MDLNVEALASHWISNNHQTLSLAFASKEKVTTFQTPYDNHSLNRPLPLRTWPLGSY